MKNLSSSLCLHTHIHTHFWLCLSIIKGLRRWLSGKEFVYQCRSQGSIPAWGRSPGGGSGKPLQYSCLGNHLDRGAWRAIYIVHGVTRVTDHTHISISKITDIFEQTSLESLCFSFLNLDLVSIGVSSKWVLRSRMVYSPT